MKKILCLMTVVAFSITAFSQMQTIQLNAKKLQFDDGRDLPSEKTFLINADAALPVVMVKMQLTRNDVESSNILYESQWIRKDGDNTTVALLPNHYKLKNGRDYNFRFLYYRKLQEAERQQIRSMVENTVMSLLQSSIEQKEDRYKFSSSPKDIFMTMNQAIKEGMVNYETKSGTASPAFSEVIENLLQSLVKMKVSKDASGKPLEDRWNELHQQIVNEIEMMANNYQYVIRESIVIPDYPVEKKNNLLALNLGYGGVYNAGSFSDLDYFTGPYAGVSFPLGNRIFNGSFWNNASLSAGVFLKDFKTSDSTYASGPVVKKPLYAALGYRVFNYFKIHAGAAILEEENKWKNSKSVSLKPFVGLSVEVNLWLGFDKK